MRRFELRAAKFQSMKNINLNYELDKKNLNCAVGMQAEVKLNYHDEGSFLIAIPV